VISFLTFFVSLFTIFFNIYFLYVAMGRVHCGIYRGLNCIKYIIHGFTSSTILLSSLPQFMEQFQQIIFLHLHTCVNSIYTIFTLLPLFLPLPPWAVPVSLFCS
jgi:hypothetical protein